MATNRPTSVVAGQVVWMGLAVVVLTTLGIFSLEGFFLWSVVGLLALADLTEPLAVRPPWRVRLRIVVFVGLLGFGLVITRRILLHIPPDLLPW